MSDAWNTRPACRPLVGDSASDFQGHTEWGWCKGRARSDFRVGKAGVCSPRRFGCETVVEIDRTGRWWCGEDTSAASKWLRPSGHLSLFAHLEDGEPMTCCATWIDDVLVAVWLGRLPPYANDLLSEATLRAQWRTGNRAAVSRLAAELGVIRYYDAPDLYADGPLLARVRSYGVTWAELRALAATYKTQRKEEKRRRASGA